MKENIDVCNAVPQVFFDLIARLIPGVFLLCVFLFSINGIEGYSGMLSEWLAPAAEGKKEFPSVTLLFAIALIVSYIFSILSWGGWYFFHYLYRKVRGELEVTDLETGIVFNSRAELLSFQEHYLKIKEVFPEAGSRITKLKAEIHMTSCLVSGSSVAFCLRIFICFFNELRLKTQYDDFLFCSECFVISLLILGAESSRHHFTDHLKKSIEILSKEISAINLKSGTGSVWYKRVLKRKG